MDVLKLLEYVQEIIETASKVPMTGKIMVDKKEITEAIYKIINYMPSEFKKAQWVYEEKDRIISEAQKEAEEIKKQNIEVLKRQIENHDIVSEAKERAEEIISSAQNDAKALRLGAREYADEILSELEKEISDKSDKMLNSIKDEMERFISSLEGEVKFTSDTIRENIQELRSMKK